MGTKEAISENTPDGVPANREAVTGSLHLMRDIIMWCSEIWIFIKVSDL